MATWPKKLCSLNWISVVVWLVGISLSYGSFFLADFLYQEDLKVRIERINSENLNLAHSLGQSVNRTFTQADGILLFMKTAIEANGDVDPAHLALLKTFRSQSVIDQISVADAQGNLLFSAAVWPLKEILNISDREHFKAHTQTDTGQVFISSPRFTQVTGTSSIYLSRRLNDANGNFAGVVSIGLNQDYFQEVFRQMDIGPNKSILLLRTDGSFLARVPSLQTTQQMLYFKGHPSLALINQGITSGAYEARGVEEIPRMGAFQLLADYPGIVTVAVQKNNALADVTARYKNYRIGAALFSAILLLSFASLSWLGRKQHTTDLAYQVSETKYRAIFETANDGIYLRDIKTRSVIDVNEKACNLCGFSREEILAGTDDIIGTEDSPYSEKEAEQWFMLASAGEPQVFEWKNRHKDGHYIWVEVSLKRVTIGESDYILGFIRDISERKAQEIELRRMAYHDTLTGLFNRTYLMERFEEEMELARKGEASGAILFIDIDDLKMINDTFGHTTGDKVIITAGNAIAATVGEKDVVARIGGDEFVVMLPMEDPDRKKVEDVIHMIANALRRNYDVGDTYTHMSPSIGVALYPHDGETVEEILKKADLALYAAKGNGKNTWRFYEAGQEKVAYENMLLKNALREAIEHGELSLHYQPIVDVNGHKIVGFEALLRWTSTTHGSVPPSRFIPLAEESDTIYKIGRWVIEEACRFAKRLEQIGKGNIVVAVNVSPRQLAADDFIAVVQNAVRNAGINPGQLEIEITENVLASTLDDSIRKLQEIKSLGISLSLDDFGTGYSSLTRLRMLPVNTLKIDKSFTDQILSDKTQSLYINSIVNMAQILGLAVVAEGVETEKQLEMLEKCQCSYIQGYFFSRPIPEKDAILLISEERVV